jgi:TolB-like protein
MLTARMSGAVPPIAPLRPDVPQALEALIGRCLAADPADRPQTARELVELLEAPELVSSASPSGATPALTPERPRGRRRLTVAAASVAAVLALAGGLAAWHVRAGAAPARPSSTSASTPAAPLDEVAVIPFVDLGDDSSGAVFAEGLTNAVAGSLTKSGRLRVIAPSLASQIMQRAGQSGGRGAVGASMLLEGTVQRDRGRLRVTARLTNVSDGVMRWADVYDRDSANALAVQDEIAAAIVAAISPQGAQPGTGPAASAPVARPVTQRRT